MHIRAPILGVHHGQVTWTRLPQVRDAVRADAQRVLREAQTDAT